MQLIVWRHCDAEAGVPDALRRLTARGRSEAALMARWLSSRLPADARVLVSPAKRAQQTAAALGRAFETVAELAPGAAVGDVLQAAGWPAGRTTLVVGHEPTLGEVVAQLLRNESALRPLPKGGVVWLVQAEIASPAVLHLAADPASVGR